MEINLGGFGIEAGIDTANAAQLNDADNAAQIAIAQIQANALNSAAAESEDFTVYYIVGGGILFLAIVLIILFS